jgi:hypothetical protein
MRKVPESDPEMQLVKECAEPVVHLLHVPIEVDLAPVATSSS